MSKEKNKDDKIILPKALQTDMMKFFLEVAIRQKKQEQIKKLLSEKNDRRDE